jgi:o-succinylbenzoate synthase
MVALSYATHVLQFRFDAGTSRGVLKQKTVYFIRIDYQGKIGYGEYAPLVGLSPELIQEIPFTTLWQALVQDWQHHFPMDKEALQQSLDRLNASTTPAFAFAIETAWYGLMCGGLAKPMFEEAKAFVAGEARLPINGLIWMGEKDFMQAQFEAKVQSGFRCIKMKMGALDTEQELNILQGWRKRFPASKLTLRVDANGAFTEEEAREVMHTLAKLEVHSIEQPIRPGQYDALNHLCEMQGLCPVALDEELIGIAKAEDRFALLQKVKAPYLVLKPSLHGGISGLREWVALANSMGRKWWMTSMLESSLGLNAITQLAFALGAEGFQGLGTGGLFHNNIASPLEIQDGGYMAWNTAHSWDESFWSTLHWQH